MPDTVAVILPLASIDHVWFVTVPKQLVNVFFAQSGIASRFSSKYFAFSGSFMHFFRKALDTVTVVGIPDIDVFPVFI